MMRAHDTVKADVVYGFPPGLMNGHAKTIYVLKKEEFEKKYRIKSKAVVELITSYGYVGGPTHQRSPLFLHNKSFWTSWINRLAQQLGLAISIDAEW